MSGPVSKAPSSLLDGLPSEIQLAPAAGGLETLPLELIEKLKDMGLHQELIEREKAEPEDEEIMDLRLHVPSNLPENYQPVRNPVIKPIEWDQVETPEMKREKAERIEKILREAEEEEERESLMEFAELKKEEKQSSSAVGEGEEVVEPPKSALSRRRSSAAKSVRWNDTVEHSDQTESQLEESPTTTTSTPTPMVVTPTPQGPKPPVDQSTSNSIMSLKVVEHPVIAPKSRRSQRGVEEDETDEDEEDDGDYDYELSDLSDMEDEMNFRQAVLEYNRLRESMAARGGLGELGGGDVGELDGEFVPLDASIGIDDTIQSSMVDENGKKISRFKSSLLPSHTSATSLLSIPTVVPAGGLKGAIRVGKLENGKLVAGGDGQEDEDDDDEENFTPDEIAAREALMRGMIGGVIIPGNDEGAAEQVRTLDGKITPLERRAGKDKIPEIKSSKSTLPLASTSAAPSSTTTPQSLVIDPITPLLPRFDFFQSESEVTISVYIKTELTADLSITFSTSEVKIRTGSRTISLTPLEHQIIPCHCAFKALPMKLEVKLKKLKDGIKWNWATKIVEEKPAVEEAEVLEQPKAQPPPSVVIENSPKEVAPSSIPDVSPSVTTSPGLKAASVKAAFGGVTERVSAAPVAASVTAPTTVPAPVPSDPASSAVPPIAGPPVKMSKFKMRKLGLEA